MCLKELQDIIQQKYSLTFLEISQEGNLCFITNSDLQNEFRQYFTYKDLRDFIYSYGKKEFEIPTTVTEFWERVALGRESNL